MQYYANIKRKIFLSLWELFCWLCSGGSVHIVYKTICYYYPPLLCKLYYQLQADIMECLCIYFGHFLLTSSHHSSVSTQTTTPHGRKVVNLVNFLGPKPLSQCSIMQISKGKSSFPFGSYSAGCVQVVQYTLYTKQFVIIIHLFYANYIINIIMLLTTIKNKYCHNLSTHI